MKAELWFDITEAVCIINIVIQFLYLGFIAFIYLRPQSAGLDCSGAKRRSKRIQFTDRALSRRLIASGNTELNSETK